LALRWKAERRSEAKARRLLEVQEYAGIISAESFGVVIFASADGRVDPRHGTKPNLRKRLTKSITAAPDPWERPQGDHSSPAHQEPSDRNNPCWRRRRPLGKAPRHEIAGVGHRRCRGLYGDLAAASGWVRLDRSRRPDRFTLKYGCGRRDERADALGERIGDATVGRLSARGRRGWRRPRASENGERHWGGGAVATAS